MTEEDAASEGPEEAVEAEEAPAAAEESTAGDEGPEEPGAEEGEVPGRLAGLVNRWLEQIADRWSQALDTRTGFEAQQLSVADGGGLEAAIGGAAVAVRATVTGAGLELPAALLAAEDAALTVARAALHDEGHETLDEGALSAFGELARLVWSSLEAVFKAEGVEGVAVEPAEPERVEEGISGFDAAVTLLCSASCSIEGAPEARFNLLLPVEIEKCAAPAAGREAAGADLVTAAPNIRRILAVRVPLVVQIASRATTVKEVLAFRPGTVVEFDKKSDDLLDLFAAKAPIGRGEAIKVGESFGIRVLEIGGLRERIESLSG